MGRSGRLKVKKVGNKTLRDQIDSNNEKYYIPMLQYLKEVLYDYHDWYNKIYQYRSQGNQDEYERLIVRRFKMFFLLDK